ncbi:MAG: hypothetical protein HY660_01130, partial [Armatimonadetes bacterium]|nr:hypothetical protein [Armatimonadota bacterium]
PNVLCALNFDSVGHHQERLKSSLVFYRIPDSLPTYINDLGLWLLDHLPKEAAWPFKQEGIIPLVSFVSVPYGPWSDNQRWNGMGVPSPLIMSWPDRYFHTQLLTADNTDPLVFHRAGLVSTMLALAIADAGPVEAAQFARLVGTYAEMRLGLASERGMAEGGRTGDPAALARIAAEIRHLATRDVRAIESTASLVRHDPEQADQAHRQVVAETTARLRRRLRQALDALGAPLRASRVADGPGATVLVRQVAGPPPRTFGLDYAEMARLVGAMQAADRRACWDTLIVLSDELWNLADGRRTLDEIATIAGAQFGLALEAGHLEVLARGLERAGYFRLRRRRRSRVSVST